MDDLDDELRRLFNDDRLDVHVTPDATDAVVRGADRRRRHRTAVTGAFAVVALIGAGVGLSQLRLPSDNTAGPLLPTSSSSSSATPPPSVSTHTETVTVTVDPPEPGSTGSNPGNNNPGNPTKPRTTSPAPPTPEAGPGVYGKLALGMSEEAALKTGSLGEPGATTDPEPKCKPYATQSVPNDLTAVIISTTKGIVRITLPNFAKTSKNIGAGSKVTELKAAYPTATQNGSEIVVPMVATPKWLYVFENDGTTVTTVRMRLADNDCPGA